MPKIYSFSKAQRSKEDQNNILGPGQYNPNFVKKNLPSFSFGNSKKWTKFDTFTPGPKYNINNSNLKKAPEIIMKQKYSQKIDSLNPGPGVYDPLNQKIKNSPKYSFGWKLNKIESNENPGPGKYESINKEKIKYGKIGKDKKKDLTNKNNVPGPGMYYSELNNFNNKLGKFGKSNKNTGENNLMPGPGTYEFKNFLENKKGITMIPRRLIESVNTNKIGPGNYYKENIDIIKRNIPKYKFGTEKKLTIENKSNNPPPDKYQNIDYKNSGPNWKFGSSLKGNTRPNSAYNPGPGHYKCLDFIGKGKKYTLGKKLNNISNKFNNNIGPGEYNIKFNLTNKNNPKWKIGKEKRVKEIRINQIGPGSYEVSENKNKLLGKFGKDSKLADLISEKKNNPGPGNYNLRDFEYKSLANTGFLLTSNNKKNFDFKNENPGPGNYNPNINLTKKRPMSCKINKNYNENTNKNRIQTPGPGAYEIYGKGKKRNDPKWVFGSENKIVIKVDQNKPGPGQYEVKNLGKNLKYSFGQKLNKMQNENLNPGPNHYDLKYQSIKVASPKINFLTDKRFKNKNKDFNIGPGQYNIVKKVKLIKGGAIGKSKKDDLLLNENPGPGNYEYRSIFEENLDWIKGTNTLNSRPFSSYEKKNYNNRPNTPNYDIGKEKRLIEKNKLLNSNNANDNFNKIPNRYN